MQDEIKTFDLFIGCHPQFHDRTNNLQDNKGHNHSINQHRHHSYYLRSQLTTHTGDAISKTIATKDTQFGRGEYTGH